MTACRKDARQADFSYRVNIAPQDRNGLGGLSNYAETFRPASVFSWVDQKKMEKGWGNLSISPPIVFIYGVLSAELLLSFTVNVSPCSHMPSFSTVTQI